MSDKESVIIVGGRTLGKTAKMIEEIKKAGLPVTVKFPEVKPILFVRLPRQAHQESLHITRETLKKDLKDYHTLVTIGTDNNEVEMEVFFEKDFNEVKYEELKSIIKKHAV